MAGRGGGDHPGSSGSFDRRDDRVPAAYHNRSADYRDRSSERYHGSPRELISDRERESISYRDPSIRRSLDKSTSNRSINAGEHGKIWDQQEGHEKSMAYSVQTGSGTPSSAPSGRRILKPGQQAMMELLGDMAHHRNQLHQAEAKLQRTKRELSQSNTRPTEFASVEDLKRREVQRYEDEKTKQEQKLAHIYQKLQTSFDSLVKQLQQQLPPATSDRQRETHSPVNKIQGSMSELEPRLAELQKQITSGMESHVQGELKKLKESNNNEIQYLRSSLDEEKQKTRLLVGKLEDGQRENQMLEERLSRLEQKLLGIDSKIEVQISTEVDENLNKKMSSIDEKIGKIQQLHKSSDDHTTQLASLKRSASIATESSTAASNTISTAASNATFEQLKKTVEMQGRNIKFLTNKQDSQMSKVEKLQILTASNKVDVENNEDLLKLQDVTVAEQRKKQESLEEEIASLKSMSHDQEERHKLLDKTVVGLSSTAKVLSQGQESLAADVTSLGSSFKDSKKSHDTQASEIASLEVLVQEQHKKSDVLEQSVASLQDATAGWSYQEFRRLSERVHEFPPATGLKRLLEELPPATDLQRLLKELPPAMDLKRLLKELPPTKDLKQLLADVPKLKKSMSEAMVRSSNTPTPAPVPAPAPAHMTKEMVMQMVNPQVRELGKLLKSDLSQKFTVVAENFGKTIDAANARTSKSEADVKELDERVSEIDKALKESQKEMRETSQSLQKGFREQTTEVNSMKGSIALAFQEVDKTRREAKAGTDDVQFQLTHMTDWAKNFGSKQWHDSVAQQIAAYVPAHFTGQLDSLTTRVSTLESRGNDSEGANKRRKGVNGSPLVLSGNY
jgi:chromosome segregation ATPase